MDNYYWAGPYPPGWWHVARPLVEPSLDVLKRMLDGPPDCWSAIQLLGYREDDESPALLVEQMASADPSRRWAAIRAVPDHRKGPEALVAVRRLLHDSSKAVVLGAIEATARLNDHESHDTILSLLADHDHTSSHIIRTGALTALDTLWRYGDFAPVLEVLRNDPAHECRFRASFLQADHAGPGDEWRLLIDVWRNSELPRERSRVCRLVERPGSASDEATIAPYLSDHDGHVRAAARRATGALSMRGRETRRH